MNKMLAAAQAAKMEIAQLTTEQKNAALLAMAQALLDNANEILAANAQDMAAAKGVVSALGGPWAMALGMVCAVTLRCLSYRFKWSLPRANLGEEEKDHGRK